MNIAMLKRTRNALVLALLCIAGAWTTSAYAGANDTLSVNAVRRAPGHIVTVESDAPGRGDVKLTRQWTDQICRSNLVNKGTHAVRIKEIILFSIRHTLPAETRLYGEGFQMLSQTGGTLGQPLDLARYTDAGHYKISQPEGARTVYGMLTLSPPKGRRMVMGFTSCRRFVGKFYLRDHAIEAVLDTENLTLSPGERWDLEEFMFADGPERAALLTSLANRINRNHPPLRFKAPPTGWCSWYCFGPRVTAQQVLDNLDFISKSIPRLKYIQIDDGYQPAMGDWLETGKAFGGDIQSVLTQIRQRGFQPAIWVAPFIAEENSHVFQEHPDWFIKDAEGKPLPSNRVTFGGWRRGPWYALDGTHPEVQKHLERVFQTMRQQWGCTYFKLDANFWGAMHGGRFHDPKATRVEAYRRGMQAVLRGASDSFILGCNHPIWPSFGLIHGSRSSVDISRKWETVKAAALQNLNRNWQNGRLWWNDPDAVVLTGNLSEDEFLFHATATYASGGMILSGDDLTKIPTDRLALLRKLLPPTETAANFEDESLRVGLTDLEGTRLVSLFNWGEEPQTISVRLPQPCEISDYWSHADLGRHDGLFTVNAMPKHSARLLICKPVKRSPK